jgi:hypothetical protein
MKINFNLLLIVIALWLLASMFEGCRNRPKPFQEFGKRWRERRDERQQQIPKPSPNDENQPDDSDERRQWLLPNRKRLFPIREESDLCET